jgi:hypothetical protein
MAELVSSLLTTCQGGLSAACRTHLAIIIDQASVWGELA